MREKHRLEDSMGFRGQFDEHRRFQIELLKNLGLKPGHQFLELGCGPLTAGGIGCPWLRRRYLGRPFAQRGWNAFLRQFSGKCDVRGA